MRSSVRYSNETNTDREKEKAGGWGERKDDGGEDVDGWRATIAVLFLVYDTLPEMLPRARQGVACRPDHYWHCPLMDIYECTNQRQPLPGFNAIRIDYIDSRRATFDRPCEESKPLDTRAPHVGGPGSFVESGITGKLSGLLQLRIFSFGYKVSEMVREWKRYPSCVSGWLVLLSLLL